MERRSTQDPTCAYESATGAPILLGEDVDYIDKIFCSSATNMREVPEESVHLVVTSPPYNVGMEYEEGMTATHWDILIHDVIFECKKKLAPCGRICINITNPGRKPYRTHRTYIEDVLHSYSFLHRGEIIWVKGQGRRTSSAWGSWCSASNPVLRDIHEYILVFSKGDYKKKETGTSTLSNKDFMRDTLSVWNIKPETRQLDHPCPFPVELPLRLINLYSYHGDIVLDPFMGSGTTAVAAKQAGRHFIGYDTSQEYCRIAEERVRQEVMQFEPMRAEQ